MLTVGVFKQARNLPRPLFREQVQDWSRGVKSLLTGYQYCGERSFINEELSLLAECGECSRNLADKNQGEDDNCRVDRAVSISKPKNLRFLFPHASLDLIFSSSKLMAFPLFEMRLYRPFVFFAFHILARLRWV